MVTRTRFCLLLLFGALLVPYAAYAQSATTGAIAGIVRDTTGGVLPGVTVEAASPALIEKVRTAVTDDQGNYKIIDLRPGTYSVTFSLPGFSTVKREGIELSTGFTATANAELKVGALQETVTVTGATPVVDIQNVRTQTVLTRQVLDALPVSQSMMGLGILTLGASTSFIGRNTAPMIDVGGSKGDQTAAVSIHGMRVNDQRMLYDGMTQNALSSGQARRVYMINQAGVAEVVMGTGASSAEVETGGVQLNAVPRDGGNIFSLYFLGNYTNSDLQNDNLTDEVVSRGVTNVPGVKEIYDWGIGVGGPIVKDRLWFYTPHRWWGSSEFTPGSFFNRSTSPFTYVPDPSRPGYQQAIQRDNGYRLTWQAAEKHKVAFLQSAQRRRVGYGQLSGVRAPEAAYIQTFWPMILTQGSWNNTASNRLLFEAGASYLHAPWKIHHDQPFPGAVGIVEATTGRLYGGPQGLGPTSPTVPGEKVEQSPLAQRFSVAYVQGSHNFKVGQQWTEGFANQPTTLDPALTYTFLNGRPNSLTQWAAPLVLKNRFRGLGFFAQDQWTVNRVTLNLGVRYDYFLAWVPAGTRPEGPFVPSFSYDRVDNVPKFHDITPRVGFAWDFFGNGKTAIKGSLGRYVVGVGIDFAQQNNPVGALATSSARTWNDANGNFVPDCDLKSTAANGECGPQANARFGQSVRNTFYDKEVLEGWGNRGYSWQGSVSLQHELRPGVALNVGYFRTQYGNFTVTRNELVTAADFNSYCITTPVDPRLPGGGGQQVCGLYDVTPARFGQVRNQVEPASRYGDHEERFDGIDIGMNARFRQGGLLQGGVSFGRQLLDNCYQNDRPDITAQEYIAGVPRSEGFCRMVPPWSAGTQYKFNGVYPLVWGLDASFTFQNLPGFHILANRAVPNAEIARSLGRNLAACRGAATCTLATSVSMVRPYSNFLDRVNQLDLRFSKSVRVGRGRVKGMFDLYNVFNVGTVLQANPTYGPIWQRPIEIIGGRLFKFGALLEL